MADPQPNRGPRNRYREQAKELIAEMLNDMEDRGIIERSTAVLLFPIVVVNKLYGNKKKICLDCLHVNKI